MFEPLAHFKMHYDVQHHDPAQMASIDPSRYTRAEVSQTYLRMLLNNQHKNLTYTKSDPSPVCHLKYFAQVRSRFTTLVTSIRLTSLCWPSLEGRSSQDSAPLGP